MIKIFLLFTYVTGQFPVFPQVYSNQTDPSRPGVFVLPHVELVRSYKTLAECTDAAKQSSYANITPQEPGGAVKYAYCTEAYAHN